MTQPEKIGIQREKLDVAFLAEEARKSNLLLSAQLLRSQGQDEAAAAKFAEAAEIEERLSDQCEAIGLKEKARIHLYSAASCWAQAGNFYQAIALCNELLSHPADLPVHLRQQVREFADALRSRRAKWYSELELETSKTEG